MTAASQEKQAVTDVPLDLGVGALVDGRCLLLEVIGEGAFGTLFLAEHIHIKRRVGGRASRRQVGPQRGHVDAPAIRDHGTSDPGGRLSAA